MLDVSVFAAIVWRLFRRLKIKRRSFRFALLKLCEFKHGLRRRTRNVGRLPRGKVPKGNRIGVFVKLTAKKPSARLRERRAISESGLKKFARGKYVYMDEQIDQFLTRSEKLSRRVLF